MSDAAQNASRVLGRLRSSFTDPAMMAANQSISATDSVASTQPTNPAPSTLNLVPTTQPPASNPVADHLDILDKVLTEVEQQAQAALPPEPLVVPAPPSPEPAPQPVVTPAVASEPTPQTAPEVAQAEPAQSPAPSTLLLEPSTLNPAPTTQYPAQAVPLAVDQALAEINKSYVGGAAKESLTASSAIVESGSGLQMVEVEHAPESLSVEVEGFIQHVEDHQNQLPQEIVIADGSMQLMAPPPALRPVVVLPITPEIEDEGQKKNTTWSVRWLVEWSHKLMKMFSGNIIYKEA